MAFSEFEIKSMSGLCEGTLTRNGRRLIFERSLIGVSTNGAEYRVI